MSIFFTPGRKTDVWYAIDLDTGIKQQTLKLDGTETVCPMMSNKKAPVFLGRTGMFISGIQGWQATLDDPWQGGMWSISFKLFIHCSDFVTNSYGESWD